MEEKIGELYIETEKEYKEYIGTIKKNMIMKFFIMNSISILGFPRVY